MTINDPNWVPDLLAKTAYPKAVEPFSPVPNVAPCNHPKVVEPLGPTTTPPPAID